MRRTYLLITVLSMILFTVSSCKCNKDAAQQDDMGMEQGGEPAAPALPEPTPVEVAPEAAPAPGAEAPTAPAPQAAGEGNVN